MVASSNPRWLKWAFNALVGLFERVGLQINVGKTVSMVCRPCQEAGNQSEAAYGWKMTGEGLMYQEQQKERVECGECGKEMPATLPPSPSHIRRTQPAPSVVPYTLAPPPSSSIRTPPPIDCLPPAYHADCLSHISS